MTKKKKCSVCGSRAEEGSSYCKVDRAMHRLFNTNMIMMKLRTADAMSDRERKKFLKTNREQRHKLMRMKKKDRFQKVCGDSLMLAYAIGRLIGLSVAHGNFKELTGTLAKENMNAIEYALTKTLTEANVLPLWKQ